MKVCAEPGCPELQTESRCFEHRRQVDLARGTRQQRGYGADHVRLRSDWAPLVATGNVKCWRCSEYIAATSDWDLGHDDRDRTRYRGPEHASCNRSTAGR